MPNDDLPNWLKKTNHLELNNQVVKNSRIIQINLNIISFFIKHFQNEPLINNNKQSAWLKLISMLIILILVLCSNSNRFIWSVFIIILLQTCQLSVKQIERLGHNFIKMFLCSVIFVIPNIIIGNVSATLFFIFRLAIVILNVAYFLQINSWQQIIIGLKQLHCPNLIILVLDISLKYIHTLAIFLQENLWAVRLRMVGKPLNNQRIIGKVFGQLYLNSKKYTSEVFNAMLLRGYKISSVHKSSMNLKKADYSLIATNLIVIILFITIGI
ncbi:energy-coupling factor transporter transmembrane component T [Apilactobacillus xinyiensis]|uniref:energy-coupling factor transporter transmembrane component T n=1 Tax=Apilactobacillus xinyiensis TaxID=2841032 RepID=UPI001C7DC6E0|nr:energy-coupling factor transporter transmembrane component T [Apilactobacillus xinyiensis]